MGFSKLILSILFLFHEIANSSCAPKTSNKAQPRKVIIIVKKIDRKKTVPSYLKTLVPQLYAISILCDGANINATRAENEVSNKEAHQRMRKH